MEAKMAEDKRDETIQKMFPMIHVRPEECNGEVRTYGDVLRHMGDDELAIFLMQMHANIELGILAIMRAKSYPHRTKKNQDKLPDTKEFYSMISFMRSHVSDNTDDGYELFGIENWEDLCRWQSGFNPENIWGEF